MTADEFMAAYKAGRRDFSGEDLSHQDLAGKYIPGINLQDADLSYTDFQESFLNCSDLRGATIHYTDFRDAILIGSILIDGCDLWRIRI